MQAISSNEITTRTSRIPDLVHHFLKSNISVSIWGPPGVGKSDLVKQIVKSELERYPDYGFIDFRTAMEDNIGLAGLPFVSEGRTYYAAQNRWPKPGTRGIVLADEMNRGSMSVQNACLQFFLDRRIGDYILPEEWHIVAACNREQDGGGVQRLSSAMTNRWAHVHIGVEDGGHVRPEFAEDWIKYAISANFDPVLIAYIKNNPDALFKMDNNAKAWPSPRSWSMVNKAFHQIHPPVGLAEQVVAGCIGDGIGHEYMAYCEMRAALPSIEEILKAPDKARTPKPSEVSVAYAITLGLAMAVKRDSHNFENCCKYIKRWESPEYMQSFYHEAMQANVAVAADPAWQTYRVKTTV